MASKPIDPFDSEKELRGSRRQSFLLLSLVSVVAFWRLEPLAVGLTRTADLPRWDMAKYGLAGLQLSEALRRGDLAELLGRISAMSSWPPLFPILQMPAFLAFGPEYAVPRLLVLGLYVTTLWAAFWAGTGIDPRRGNGVGLALACCLLSSPFFHLYAGLVMLEVPGALLWLLAIGAYGRALRAEEAASDDLRPWKLTALAGLALFFCKFNYGLLWLIPLAIHELYRRQGSWWASARALWRAPAALGIGPRARVAAGLWIAALAWIRLAGGIDLELFGLRLRATSIGNPVYFSTLLLLALALWRREASRRLWQRLSGVLDSRALCLLVWTLVPIGLWMLVPPHTKDFFGFVENRSSGFGFWSWQSWSFYPRALLEELAPNVRVGAGLLALGLGPVLCWRRLPPGPRMVVLSALTTAAALQWHPYKLTRFVSSLAVPLWLAASWAGIRLLDFLWQRLGARGMGTIATSAALLGLAMLAPDPADSLARRPRYTVGEEARPVLEAVTRPTEEGHEVLVLGTWNLLSPALVQWHALRRGSKPEDGQLPRVWQESRRARKEALERLRRFSEVVVIEALPSLGPGRAAEHARENRWLQPVRNELRDSGLFVLVGVEELPRAGYRVRRYRRVSSEPSSPEGASSPLSSSSRSAES